MWWNEIERRAIAFSTRRGGETCAKELTDAHHRLDRAADRLYRREPFATDADRIAMLFTRYRALTEEKTEGVPE